MEGLSLLVAQRQEAGDEDHIIYWILRPSSSSYSFGGCLVNNSDLPVLDLLQKIKVHFLVKEAYFGPIETIIIFTIIIRSPATTSHRPDPATGGA